MNIRIGFRLATAACLLWAALPAAGQVATPSPPEGEAASPPRIEIENDVVDLGVVIRGEVVVVSFAIRNVGGETLRILKAKPG